MTNKAVYKVDKKTITQPKLRAVVLWKETRGHISNICRAIGISRQTFYDWLKEDEEFNKAIQEAEWELHDEVRDALIQKIADGSSSDIQYYLNRRHPEFKPQPQVLIQNNFGDHAKKELEEFE